MGSKEWDRFGKDVWKYARELKESGIPSWSSDKRHLVLVGGLPGSQHLSLTKGSGREEFLPWLKKEGWDEISSEMYHDDALELLKDLSEKNSRIVIDRPFVTKSQRKTW